MYEVSFKLAGLGIRSAAKKMNHTDAEGKLYTSDEAGWLAIDTRRYTNGNTALPKEDKMIQWIAEIHTGIPFDSIVISGYYPLSAEELMEKALEYKSKT